MNKKNHVKKKGNNLGTEMTLLKEWVRWACRVRIKGKFERTSLEFGSIYGEFVAGYESRFWFVSL